MDNFSLPKSVIDKVNAMANKMCSELIIDAAKVVPPEEIRKIIAAALYEVKFSSGSKHRAALRKLDEVVRQYFPPVEGMPRPSTELAHVGDVFPGFVPRVPPEIYEIYPVYIPEYYENPKYRH